MLDLESYWMGRDSKYRLEWTEEVQDNGAETVMRINRLVDMYVADTGNARMETWASGWRPEGINSKTSNAAKTSRHITAQAGDVRDPVRLFAGWCNRRLEELELCGLWMEDSRWCPSWVHLQIVPPKSGNRIYIPSTKPPLCGMP